MASRKRQNTGFEPTLGVRPPVFSTTGEELPYESPSDEDELGPKAKPLDREDIIERDAIWNKADAIWNRGFVEGHIRYQRMNSADWKKAEAPMDEETAPADEAAPADEEAPGDEAAPMDEEAPADEAAPMDEAAPADEA
eukprot:CAMPEP_0119266982 /NCGR_PEP_ID=MMETSP1329-20130426/5286_1 /TAXON_ID=114041 /ORGANISM="Genus nov. species nov., Strain RCC1024" /LENGTH=138 /DNA_ID=CAMNT_0007266887 /DNA_START=143 /DNA_END=555 /DNA_ORIENTATION=+